jgi:D-alanine-D-alanine ligase
LTNEVERILSEYTQPALIEEFLPGREFTVAILGNGKTAQVLPIVEINFNEFPEDFIPMYSYEAKWILDTKENPLDVFTCPAELDKNLETKIKDTALRAYNILRCRDWSRIDIRLDKNGEPNIIEINPLPGILPNPEENSCFPKAARAVGLNYNDMINSVLLEAAKRYNIL